MQKIIKQRVEICGCSGCGYHVWGDFPLKQRMLGLSFENGNSKWVKKKLVWVKKGLMQVQEPGEFFDEQDEDIEIQSLLLFIEITGGNKPAAVSYGMRPCRPLWHRDLEKPVLPNPTR